MLRATGTMRRISVATPLGCLYLDHAFENSTYLFFPFQGKLLQFQKVMEKGNYHCIFCIPFPLLLLKVFGAVAIFRRILGQFVLQWASQFDCLSTIVHKKKKNKKIFHVIWNGLTKKNAFPLCIHTETHRHTPLQLNNLPLGDNALGVHGQARIWT